MPAAQLPDPDRVRAVTANFFFWQGLRWVPLGAMLILVSLLRVGREAFGRTITNIVALLGVIVAVWLSTSVLDRYYARTYGRVQGIPGQHARRSRIKWLIVYPAMGLALVLDWQLNAPIFISGLVFAAGIEAYRRSTGGGRIHYIVASALLAVVAFAPLTDLASSRELLVPFFGMLGAIYIIGGLLDHRELQRTLGGGRPAPAGE